MACRLTLAVFAMRGRGAGPAPEGVHESVTSA
jgi:hypothetical protein